ncbi:hypothetical protein [Streptomyces microflavus]|uniref:hypothetical protein n=1 Tax=Streptomyces microflavus TaxID=1919 RepID=UPI0033B67AE6
MKDGLLTGDYEISFGEQTLRLENGTLKVDNLVPPMIWRVLRSAPHPPPVGKDAYIIGIGPLLEDRALVEMVDENQAAVPVITGGLGTNFMIQGDSQRGWTIEWFSFLTQPPIRRPVGIQLLPGKSGPHVVVLPEGERPPVWKFTPVPEKSDR